MLRLGFAAFVLALSACGRLGYEPLAVGNRDDGGVLDDGGGAPDADPGAPDADPGAPDASVTCPAACNLGCPGGECVIRGDDLLAIACPAGMPCRVRCETATSCKVKIECGDATTCAIE